MVTPYWWLFIVRLSVETHSRASAGKREKSRLDLAAGEGGEEGDKRREGVDGGGREGEGSGDIMMAAHLR